MAIASGNGSFAASPDASNAGTAVIGSTSADNSFVRDDYSITFSQAVKITLGIALSSPITLLFIQTELFFVCIKI